MVLVLAEYALLKERHRTDSFPASFHSLRPYFGNAIVVTAKTILINGSGRASQGEMKVIEKSDFFDMRQYKT